MFEARGRPDVAHDGSQDALRIVPFTVEAPVEGVEPDLPTRVQQVGAQRSRLVQPAASDGDVDERLVPVEEEIP